MAQRVNEMPRRRRNEPLCTANAFRHLSHPTIFSNAGARSQKPGERYTGMVKSPIVFENFDCLGMCEGKEIMASSLNAACVVLASFGADQIIVPVPHERSRMGLSRGMTQIPKERRSMVKTVDESGRLFKSVISYLGPLLSQAKEWPETAFVGFSITALYKIALGIKYEASVSDSGIVEILRLMTGIDRTIFTGQARYRFSELCGFLSSFDAYNLGRLNLVVERLDADKRETLTNMLDSAEFQRVTESMGSLGYLRQPMTGIRRVNSALRTITSNNKFKKVIKMGAAGSQLPGSPLNLSALNGLVDDNPDNTRFAPPLVDLPTTLEYSMYKESLASIEPNAVPQPGTIMATEHLLTRGHSWINAGEEYRISYDPVKSLTYNRKAIEQARNYLLNRPVERVEYRY